MAEAKPTGAGAPVPSADELRMMLLESQMKEMEKREKFRAVEEKKRAEFAAGFLGDHVTEAERTLIRRLVKAAVKDGKMEAMIYSFPSKLCTDGGRAINNNDKNWPPHSRARRSSFMIGISRS